MEVFLLNGILAFVAGILLNFTPCVLPVIPLKVQAVLREIQENTRSRLLAAGALLAGSLLFFIIVGIFTATLGWKWGEIFQSKIFLGFLSVFLMASGIAMLANWSFRIPQSIYKIPIHRTMGAFLTGILAGILSTPCSGPFLGGVLTYAVTQSPAVTILIFTAIGLGLAFPYVGILILPQFIKYLPKNDRLGMQIESILAFVLIAGALFFAQSVIPHSIHAVLWWGFALSVFAWSIVSLMRSQKWSCRLPGRYDRLRREREKTPGSIRRYSPSLRGADQPKRRNRPDVFWDVQCRLT